MNSLIGWVGGKKNLRKYILPMIPKHDLYCEVFGGAGWVLFGKSPDKEQWQLDKKVRYKEIYNDVNSELVNFWKHIKHHPNAFVTELNEHIVSREIWDDFFKKSTDGINAVSTELQRAIRFYYLLTMSYGSMSGHFCCKNSRVNALPLKNLEIAQKATERLKNVNIECLDFEKLITKFDGENTFFYLDPPYYQKEDLYISLDTPIFDGHERLAETLKNIKGKFLLSYNDCEYVKELYKDFVVETIETKYQLAGKGRGRNVTTELLVRNYD
jgi:DNA adenine methylase